MKITDEEALDLNLATMKLMPEELKKEEIKRMAEGKPWSKEFENIQAEIFPEWLLTRGLKVNN